MSASTPCLSATIQLLQGGLAGLADGGRAHLEGWIAALEGNHVLMGTYNELVALLQDLAAAVDAGKIHLHLDTLARFTYGTADAAPAESRAELHQLAEAIQGLAAQVR